MKSHTKEMKLQIDNSINNALEIFTKVYGGEVDIVHGRFFVDPLYKDEFVVDSSYFDHNFEISISNNVFSNLSVNELSEIKKKIDTEEIKKFKDQTKTELEIVKDNLIIIYPIKSDYAKLELVPMLLLLEISSTLAYADLLKLIIENI